MKQRWKVLLVTSVAVFMGFLDVTIVNIAFPDIEASFPGTSLAGLSWILNAYNILFAALLVPAGRLSDRLGRRRMFFVGVWTFLAASAVCGLAPSVEVLVGARAVQAAGAAILVPTSLALLLPEFPLEQRATATALWGAAGGIAAATGPALGGVLVAATSWRSVFFVNLAIGLPALIPARRLLHESREPNPGPLTDILGIVLLVAGVGLLSLGIVKGQDWGWGSAQVVGSLAASALALAAFVARSARHPAPVIELGLLRVRSFAVANVGVFLFALGFYAVLLANILFLTSVWGWSVLRAGIAVTPGPLMAALWATVGGRLSDRFGQRVVALPGGLLFAAGCVVFATATGSVPHYAGEFLPATLLTGTGVGLSFAAWGSAAVAELPPSRFATGSAISATSRQIGAVLGIAVLVAVIGTPRPEDAISTFHTAWALMAIPATAAGLTALALGRVRARNPEAAVTLATAEA
ncbi:MAG TPA: DHA2 family efflux MFS transporter permease subunit [Solirubrobacteraceae bacterium]|jgi:EmrB/QacA subfamily drug resistance transporter|nr:DHA2 family efflux MFS transporter permease subunit [Solirubrobacteraceae bacterium]